MIFYIQPEHLNWYLLIKRYRWTDLHWLIVVVSNTEYHHSPIVNGKLNIWWNNHNLTCHLHLANQMHILFLVFLCDQDIGSIWLEVSHFTHPKLLDLHKQSTWRLSVLLVLQSFSLIFYWKSRMVSINSILRPSDFKLHICSTYFMRT